MAGKFRLIITHWEAWLKLAQKWAKGDNLPTTPKQLQQQMIAAGATQPPAYRLNITDWEQWGKLVKTWATGSTNYLGQVYTWPTTPQELQAQMTAVTAGTVPPNIQSVQVNQMTDSLLVLTLPPSDDVTTFEAFIATNPYPLPKFYKDCCGNVDVKNSLELTFSNARVGEYVIGYCA